MAIAPADALQGAGLFGVSPYLADSQMFPSAPLPPETGLYYSEYGAKKSREIGGIADIGASGNRGIGKSKTLPLITQMIRIPGIWDREVAGIG